MNWIQVLRKGEVSRRTPFMGFFPEVEEFKGWMC